MIALELVGGVGGGPERNRGLASLERGFEVADDGGRASRPPLPAAEVATLRSFLESLYEGELDLRDASRVAGRLRGLLLEGVPAAERLRTLGDRVRRLELRGDPAAFGLLSDLPWELTALSADPDGRSASSLFAGTLAGFPLVRVLSTGAPPGRPPAGPGRSQRLRVLYTIARPREGFALTLNTEDFQKQRADLTARYPQVDWRCGDDDPDRLRWQIERFAPHLFVIVAHGAADYRGSPSVMMPHGWKRLEDVGGWLAGSGTAMALLIACDTARRSSSVIQSGAVALVEAGVPEVLAMQGKISQGIARKFLRTTLTGLLLRTSGCEAAAFGRRQVSDGLAAFTPTLYAAASAAGESAIQQTLTVYLRETRRLLDRLPKIESHLPRPELEGELEALLEGSGLVHVTGGHGFGCSHLASHVLRRAFESSSAPAPRPVLWVDLDRARDESGFARAPQVVLREALRDLGALSAEGLSVATDAEETLEAVDEARIILVLDHLDPAANQEGGFWSGFLAEASGRLKSSLLIALRMPEPWTAPDLPSVRIGRFSFEETRRYLETFAGRLGPHALEVYNLTDGIPALLSAVGKGIGRGLERVSEKGLAEAVAVPMQSYLGSVRKLAGERPFDALCRLSWLREATTADLALELVIPGGEQELKDLTGLGVVKSYSRHGENWCLVSSAVAAALRELYRAELEAAGSGFSADFARGLERRIGNSPEAAEKPEALALQELLRIPGGASVLCGAQEALHAEGEAFAEFARQMPLLCYEDGGESEGLWRLFEFVADRMPNESSADVLVTLAGIAERLGKHEATARWLEELTPRELSDYWRARALGTRAAFLKDTRQREAAAEIEASYRQAIEIASRRLEKPGEDADRPEWAALLGGLLTNQLIYRLFLGGGVDRDAAERAAERVRELAGDESYANLLCCLAEAERRKSEEGVAWDQVAEYLILAGELLEGSSNLRYRNYYLYQQGRYLEQRHAQFEEAERYYGLAEETAVAAGEGRRRALARLRRVEVRWSELGLEAREACAQLDDSLARLSVEVTDSLALRVAERTNSLRARIGRELTGDPTDRFLKNACVAAAHLPLDSKRDRERCAWAFVEYLRFARRRLGLTEAQRLLARFREPLESRLKVAVRLDDPWATLDQLEAGYPGKET